MESVMEPIRVPGPGATAFHKNRRISDLLLSQIAHFQHVAKKRSLKIDPEVARDVHTEGGAARYIGTVTRALRKSAAAPPVTLVPAERRDGTRPGTRERIPASGSVPRIAAAVKDSKRSRSKKQGTSKLASDRDTTLSKQSKSRTAKAKKATAQKGSKVRAKTKPAKRKKP
jgi:hypothetical protein